MSKVKLPAYTSAKRLAGGRTGYFWTRPTWADPKFATSKNEKKRGLAVRNGKTCPVESTALGEDLGPAIIKAQAINEAFKEWRTGAEAKATEGSVKWLFAWYRQQDKFTKNRHTTRAGYQICMDAVCEMAMKVGFFGTRRAGVIDGPAADALYKKAVEKHGDRQGSYMMQVCRLVWNHASRPGYSKATGVTTNPFAGMSIKASSGAGRGNRDATRAEYDLYRKTARDMGLQSMATAAALCFECCQRVWDVFGFDDPDGRVVRGFFWDDYIPGVSITVVQSKTGKLITLPLSATVEGEAVPLYPDLEEELARTPRTGAEGEMIVRRELDGAGYPASYMLKRHRAIRSKAGLPADFKFTGFRHGGITELGDAGADDMRAISGHTKLETTAIYNKANVNKARAIALKRREHVALITAGEKEPEA